MGKDVYCRRIRFSGGKVGVKKRGAETQTAAQMGGGLRRRCEMPITTWLLHLHAHEERVPRIGGRRDCESRFAINWRIKGDVDIVG